jgi:hypothetical protein
MERYSRCLLASVLFLLIALFCIPDCSAAQPTRQQPHSTAYLQEMPAPERVLTDFTSALNSLPLFGPMSTARRQIAALVGLINVTKLMREGGEFGKWGTAEEQAVVGSYIKAIESIKSRDSFNAMQRQQLGIYDQKDEAVEKELLERYFSAEWQEKFLRVKGISAAERRAVQARAEVQERAVSGGQQDKQSPFNPMVLGIALAAVGFSGLLWCNPGLYALKTKSIKASTPMTACRSCGASISSNAERCPQCKTLTDPSGYYNCRNCGKPLERGRHMTTEVNTSYSLTQGTLRQMDHASITHTSCPHCGDLKPLLALELWTYLRNFLIFLGIFGIGMSGFFLLSDLLPNRQQGWVIPFGIAWGVGALFGVLSGMSYVVRRIKG